MQLLFVVIFPNRTQDASHGRFSGNNTWTKRQVPCTMPSKEGTEAKDEPMNQTESATSQPPGAIPLPDEIVATRALSPRSLRRWLPVALHARPGQSPKHKITGFGLHRPAHSRHMHDLALRHPTLNHRHGSSAVSASHMRVIAGYPRLCDYPTQFSDTVLPMQGQDDCALKHGQRAGQRKTDSE